MTLRQSALSAPVTVDIVRRHVLKEDTFGRHLGIEIETVGPGRCTAVMPLTEHTLNGLGVIHGGALFALADVAFGGAANSHGIVALNITSSINFVAAGKSGPLRAEARELRRAEKLGHYEVQIFDGNGGLLAVFRAAAYYRGDLLPGVPAPTA